MLVVGSVVVTGAAAAAVGTMRNLLVRFGDQLFLGMLGIARFCRSVSGMGIAV